MASITYPTTGQTLTSTALTPQQAQTIYQSITCTLLGIADTDPAANTAVRKSWQTEGAPAWAITDDICFVRCVTEKGWYSLVRDQGITQNQDGSVTIVREYTRIWRIFWNVWGPNGFDHARAIRSGLLLEVSSEPLSKSNLYLVTDIDEPMYAPEVDDGRWWERTSLEANFNEQITETITNPSVESVEINLNTDAGQALDFTISQS